MDFFKSIRFWDGAIRREFKEDFMAYGYRGKILRVDLTNRKIEVEDKEDIFYRTYLGVRGIGYEYLLREVPPRIDPLRCHHEG